ncbi:MAG: galactokinase [Bacteroidetes bacterium HGW-Bacteroidetes-4]|jgi:galactokinase|nr:MAG: galactokinase [Bacteroidetes bacterium HGW-Bacteroidetes-4]
MIEKIKSAFEARFENNPILVKSPGRVNLIGEHTDYNDGFVLPAAVDAAIYFACKSNKTASFRFYSYDLDDFYETPVTNIEKSNKHWANYLLGVIVQFTKAGKKVQGFDCVFGGDIPMGAGMSSSAALETGLAFAINYIESFGFETIDLVKFSQNAEHEYAGVQCGIMDQFAAMHGKSNQVIKLDCRSLDFSYYPLDMSEQMLVLVNTGVKHSLASSEYNKRRQECEAGIALLQKYQPEITSLRDVSLAFIQSHKNEFNALVYKRCTYVIEENLRLENACKALDNGDFVLFGKQMFGSHEGLKNKYEVSCDELDQLVDLAKTINGVLGARMMGGGFGGCTINLVKKETLKIFEETIKANYKTPDGKDPQIIKVSIEEGTHLVSNR